MSVFSTENLSFRYASSDRDAIEGVNIRSEEEEHTVLLGSSGSGRSTLLNCVARTAPKHFPGRLEGKVFLFGEDVTDASITDVAGRVGIVFEDFENQLFCATVESETAFGAESLGCSVVEIEKRIVEALECVGLEGLRRRAPWTLSGGQKQRLAIAATVAMKPSLLLLDEVTSQLDPRGKEEIVRTLTRLQGEFTTLSAETEAESGVDANRVVLMREGKVEKAGRPEDVLTDNAALRDCGVEPLDACFLFEMLGEDERPLTADAAVQTLKAKGYEVVDGETATKGSSGEEVVVEVDGLSHRYEGGVVALEGVSVRFHKGELVALIGQNGSGKTTLAKHLNGLLEPTDGSVVVKGRRTEDYHSNELQRVSAYLFQNPDEQLFARSAVEEVAFGLRNFGFRGDELKRRIDAALEVVGLAARAEDDPRTFGIGEKQRIAVASVIAYEPDVLILDEPTTGLDVGQQRRVMEIALDARRRGTCVILITHSMRLVTEFCDRVVALRDGKVAFDGGVRELFSNETLLKSLHLEPPQVTRIGYAFGATFLTVEEAAARLKKGKKDAV